MLHQKILTSHLCPYWFRRICLLISRTLFQQKSIGKCTKTNNENSPSGCDVTSKVSTKAAALTKNPDEYLQYFGEKDVDTDLPCKNGENYILELLLCVLCYVQFNPCMFGWICINTVMMPEKVICPSITQ